jgi:flagellar basal body-associated protein FliL
VASQPKSGAEKDKRAFLLFVVLLVGILVGIGGMSLFAFRSESKEQPPSQAELTVTVPPVVASSRDAATIRAAVDIVAADMPARTSLQSRKDELAADVTRAIAEIDLSAPPAAQMAELRRQVRDRVDPNGDKVSSVFLREYVAR